MSSRSIFGVATAGLSSSLPLTFPTHFHNCKCTLREDAARLSQRVRGLQLSAQKTSMERYPYVRLNKTQFTTRNGTFLVSRRRFGAALTLGTLLRKVTGRNQINSLALLDGSSTLQIQSKSSWELRAGTSLKEHTQEQFVEIQSKGRRAPSFVSLTNLSPHSQATEQHQNRTESPRGSLEEISRALYVAKPHQVVL